MKNFFESTKFKILLAILAVIIGLMIAGVYSEGSATFFSNLFSGIITPVQSTSSNISNSVSNFFQKFTDYNALYDENQRLHQDLSQAHSQIADYNNIKTENEQYKRLIDIVATNDDWQLTPANVVSRDSQSRFYSFGIDKGSLNGISYLDPVMSADGLIGYISEVSVSSAKVITILDVKMDVGVYDSESRDIGVLTSTVVISESGQCVMKFLPRESAIMKGHHIYTSGSLTGSVSIFPRDLYVGTVVSTHSSDSKTNTEAIIKPGADIESVRDVFVLTDFKGKGSS